MNISEYVTHRAIREVLHFTTSAGALGVLAARALLPRSQLEKEQLIEFILKKNCDVRKDPQWANHNSLSITSINTRFFEFSKTQHDTSAVPWWCILAFDPVILEHPNVFFCTGNNTWPASKRSTGIEGLKALFAARVPGRFNTYEHRTEHTPINAPTSNQAEVLYPGRLAIEFLTRVYFEEQEHADHFLAQASALSVALPPDVAVVEPRRFYQAG